MGENKRREIILASGSAKRAELLTKLGLKFRVVKSGCQEDMGPAKNPRALVRSLALQKARCVATSNPNSIIIAADTIGVLGKKIFGKARDAKDAQETIKALSGRMHVAMTGFAIIDTHTGKQMSCVTSSRVWFRKLTQQEIAQYIQSKDWKGKAASYTLLGRAGAFVQRIEGEPGTILGLPMCALTKALKQFNILS